MIDESIKYSPGLGHAKLLQSSPGALYGQMIAVLSWRVVALDAAFFTWSQFRFTRVNAFNPTRLVVLFATRIGVKYYNSNDCVLNSSKKIDPPSKDRASSGDCYSQVSNYGTT
jgi:hypothetical protein